MKYAKLAIAFLLIGCGAHPPIETSDDAIQYLNKLYPGQGVCILVLNPYDCITCVNYFSTGFRSSSYDLGNNQIKVIVIPELRKIEIEKIKTDSKKGVEPPDTILSNQLIYDKLQDLNPISLNNSFIIYTDEKGNVLKSQNLQQTQVLSDY